MPLRRAKIGALLGAALVAGTIELACNAILGNSEGQFVPDASAPPDAHDVTQTDGSVSLADAGDDATPAVDGSSYDAATGFCASISPAPSFCADFDDTDGGGGLYGFATGTAGSGCSLTRETTNQSPPLALRAVTTNLNTGCYLTTQVAPTHTIAIDLDVRMHALPGSPGGFDGIFTLREGNLRYTLYASKGAVFFQGTNGVQAQDSDHLPAPVLDVYHHVHMQLVLASGTAPIMSGTYDQTTVTFGGKPQNATLGPFEPGTSTDVRVGLPEVVLTNTGDVLIDNVVVRVQ